jgi:hypothetical protein
LLKDTIAKIQKEFLNEAQSSPKLLEDLAAMEKYIAESYGNRIIIELIQNADDAGSKRVKLFYRDNHILFANDGNEFTDKDVLSICRSGSSTKIRGSSIGYRGIGFKSTSNIGKEILIYSSKIVFTFSKKRCAKVLKVTDKNKIPVVRIPFMVEYSDLSESVQESIEELKKEGYTTIFIFVDAQRELIEDEIKEVDSGYFIFLNNITEADFNSRNLQKRFNIERVKGSSSSIISITEKSRNDSWAVFRGSYKGKKSDIAFRISEDGTLVRCDDSEATFHCYLPTLEKTGYGFKINSDFSTDPSRKHLTFDDETTRAVEASSHMMFDLICEVVNGRITGVSDDIFKMLMQRSSFSKAAIKLTEGLEKLLSSGIWLENGKGVRIKLGSYKPKPTWLEPSEYKIVREFSSYLDGYCPPFKLSETYPSMDMFLAKYSSNTVCAEDLIKILQDSRTVENINGKLYGKLYSNLIRLMKMPYEKSTKESEVKKCLLYNHGKVVTIQELSLLKSSEIILKKDFIDGIVENLFSSTDLEWFDNKFGLSLSKSAAKAFKFKSSENVEDSQKKETHTFSWSASRKSKEEDQKKDGASYIPFISRWRSAEYIVVELEKSMGNNARDVSVQNLGYDVESITPDGITRYIEVKSVTSDNGIFTMTNNEYSEANQKKDSYMICIVLQSEKELKLTYIKDPVNSLELEKRCRAWEWVCNRYNGGDTFTIPMK